MYQTNATEKAIHTYKDNLIADLVSTNPSFYIYLWCYIFPYTNTTLNLLRRSRVNPIISTEALLNVSDPKATSRTAAHFFLSRKPQEGKLLEKFQPNGPIHIISKIIKSEMGSATEAEIGTMRGVPRK